MKINVTVMMGMLMLGLLSGCETIKHTVSGPFIGAEKDVQNLKETHPLEKISKADQWVRENMW